MISRLNAPFRKLFLSSGLRSTPVATQQTNFVYFKPFLLAAAATVLLSFFVGFVFISLAGYLSAADQAQDVQMNMKPTKHIQLLLQDSSAQQNELKPFISHIKQNHLAGFKATDACVTVQLSNSVVYRLHCESTYQETASPDERLVSQIMSQLDAKGIEYELLKNVNNTVLLCDSEWIISWGGVLYVPQITI